MAKYSALDMQDFVRVVKALADRNRIRILLALKEHELCVCQITELLDLAPSTVSKHMSLLKAARLIEARKDSRWVFHHIADDKASAAAKDAVAWVFRSLANDSEVEEDRTRLKKILKIDPEIICRRRRIKIK